jgi:hypothetical protein
VVSSVSPYPIERAHTMRPYPAPSRIGKGAGGLGQKLLHRRDESVRLVVGDGVAAAGEVDEAGVR